MRGSYVTETQKSWHTHRTHGKRRGFCPAARHWQSARVHTKKHSSFFSFCIKTGLGMSCLEEPGHVRPWVLKKSEIPCPVLGKRHDGVDDACINFNLSCLMICFESSCPAERTRSGASGPRQMSWQSLCYED